MPPEDRRLWYDGAVAEHARSQHNRIEASTFPHLDRTADRQAIMRRLKSMLPDDDQAITEEQGRKNRESLKIFLKTGVKT